MSQEPAHDGSDWNADVLAWNIDRWINEPKSVTKGLMGGIDWQNPTAVVDQHTLKVNLTGPTPTLLSQFNDPNTYPMSKAAFEKLGPDQAGQAPVGTGPFKFVEWRKNDRVTVARNENYWMKDANGQPLPYLDGITYRLIIDDSVRMLEMKAGSIDFTELIQGKDVPEAKADPTLEYIEADWVGNAYRLIFNAQGGKFHDNVKLRQATLYAINREALAQALGGGIGVAEKYFPRPGALGYDDGAGHRTVRSGEERDAVPAARSARSVRRRNNAPSRRGGPAMLTPRACRSARVGGLLFQATWTRRVI